MRKFLSRLFPARMQEVKPLVGEERLKLLAQVADNDAGLRAVNDILGECLETEFRTAIRGDVADLDKLRAVERLRTTWVLLQMIDDERQKAQDWRRQQERA